MLKKIRQAIAIVSIFLVTLLFLDFTGTIHTWFGWMAKIQFLPALLALNVTVILSLIIVTLIFGRIYCSVICPLGIMQDGFGWLGKRAKRNRYTYSQAISWLRYLMLLIAVGAFIVGIGSIVSLLAPYSSYGRIVSSILSPLWQLTNNLLAQWAEQLDSYAFYTVDVWLKSGITLAIASITLGSLAVLSWRNGRTYCNTICPVGTILSFFSRFSLLRPVIDRTKCIECGLCARNCKASCIDIHGGKKIDYTRCVTCFDCIDKCKKGAISYTYRREKNAKNDVSAVNESRRQFLAATATIATATALHAGEKTVDGGLAVIVDKKRPKRTTKLVPAGAQGLRNFSRHCTACQLCVSVCPNAVLRPSTDADTLMQPEMSYERGYCRPECTKCSQACPSGAIKPTSKADKSSIQIGHAVWISKNCVPLTDGVECGNCARHCPAGAISMVESKQGPKIPVVNTERCIGCGACENLCPARPFSAIYVEGHESHRNV